MVEAVRDLDRRTMFAEIRKLCRPDNWTNWCVLIRDWGVYATIVAGCCAWYRLVLQQGWSVGWAIPVYLMSATVIAVWCQNRLACLVHESSHYLLFRNRVLNDVAANLFVAFPFFGTISNYRIGHWAHHRHVNDPEHDPDLKRLKRHHPRRFPISKWRFIWEYVILQLSPHKAYSYLKGRASYVSVTDKRGRVGTESVLGAPLTWALRLGFYSILFALLTSYGWWPHYFLFWLVPLVTLYPATLFLREIAHHGNYPDNGDFTNSRVYEGYWLEREIFFPFSERNHVLHHMFPTIPWHKMREGHRLMMRYPPYREGVVICDGFFFKRHRGTSDPTVLDILAAPAHTFVAGHEEGATGAIRSEMASEVGAGIPVAGQRQQGES
jgi:fatty acid desaturase